MLTSINESSSSNSSRYCAAPSDVFAPENVNPYLLQILMPEIVSGVPIPDANPTPMMMKSFVGEQVVSWALADAEIMAVWTPASPSWPLTFFVKENSSSPWGSLGRLGYNQPLYENYRKARLAAGCFTIRSGAQAAGVFTLAGMVSGVDVNQLPPFENLNYNTLLSYIPNAGVYETAVPIESGIVSLHQPNGYNEFYTPDSDTNIRVEDYWTSTWESENLKTDGWVVGSGVALGPGVSGVIWDSDVAPPHTGSPTTLPDPFYGYCRFQADFDFASAMAPAAPCAFTFYIEITESVADPVTWLVAPVTTIVATCRFFGNALQNHVHLDTDIIFRPGLITRVRVKALNQSASTITITDADPSKNWITITSYDVLRPNVMSPAHVFIATRLNQGQPVSLSFTHTFELIPTSQIARVVQLSTDRMDDIFLEQTLAVLSRVGSGVKLMWKRKDYDRAVATRFFHELGREKTAYEAAGPSLKSRMMDLWKRVNPYISEAAIVGGKHLLKSALGGAGAIHPVLGLAGNAIASEYLSAPPSSKREWSASASEMTYDLEAPPTHLSATSDFLNIVNMKSGQLTGPRSAYFPIIPSSFDLEAKILFVTFSKTPASGLEYREATTPGGTPFAFSSDFFADQEQIEFLSALTTYAVACSIILKTTKVYYTVNFKAVDGPSWQLAALMAVLGISGGNLYSGAVTFENPLRPTIRPVGQVAAKAVLARRAGKLLVCPASLESSEIGSLTSSVGPVVFAGFLSSGRPFPSNMSAFLIESPWDVVVVGLRNFKHRITMATDIQQTIQRQSPGYNPESAKPKVVSQVVIGRLPEANKRIDALCDASLSLIQELGIQNPALATAVERSRMAWKTVCANQGHSEALSLQMTAIEAAAVKQNDKIRNYFKNSVQDATTRNLPAGATKSSIAREKKKRAAARRLAEASGHQEQGESESSGSSSVNQEAADLFGL